jgi:hypothetical protein
MTGFMKRSTLGKPSTEQERRWALIRERGCIACLVLDGGFMYPEIHHQTLGGRHGAPRLGHDFTVGLCPWHHRGDAPYPASEMEEAHGPSYAKTPKAFRREFGSDATLLREQNALIGWMQEPERAARRKPSKCTPSSKTVPRRGWLA